MPASPVHPTVRQLTAVIETQTEIARLGLDLDGVMRHVCGRAQELTEADGAAVEIADGPDMVYRAVSGIASDMAGIRIPRDGSLTGLCIAMGEPLRCAESDTDVRVNREACRKVGLRSMVVVPLSHDDHIVGVLKVMMKDTNAFTERDIALLQLMSGVIGAALYHAQHHSADALFHRATHDSLTGLANRSHFHDRLRHNLSTARRDSRCLGLVMLDMDGLKAINDAHGHNAGDEAIRVLAARLLEHVRQSDTVARLGGDEFCVVLSAVDDRKAAELARRRLCTYVEGPCVFGDIQLAVRVSAGVSLFPDDGETPEALLASADRAMYTVKRSRAR